MQRVDAFVSNAELNNYLKESMRGTLALSRELLRQLEYRIDSIQPDLNPMIVIRLKEEVDRMVRAIGEAATFGIV